MTKPKSLLKPGSLIRIKGEYYLGASIDKTEKYKNKIAIVLHIKEYPNSSLFGPYKFLTIFCSGVTLGIHLEDAKLIRE